MPADARGFAGPSRKGGQAFFWVRDQNLLRDVLCGRLSATAYPIAVAPQRLALQSADAKQDPLETNPLLDTSSIMR